MISLVATLALLPIQPFKFTYLFPVGSEAKFSVKVAFEGWIPLFGGRNGKADVDLVVLAKGVECKEPYMQAVESEIIDLKGSAFGGPLPLSKNNIGQFFPKGVATFDQGGKVKANTVLGVDMPVKLPGLDSKRLPEISYLPVFIDSEAMGFNKPYEYEIVFNKAPVKYVVTPGEIEGDTIKLNIVLSQETSGFEDAYGNPTEEEKAKSKTKTTLAGKGVAIFNIQRHMCDKVTVESIADTDVTVIKTGKTSRRNLTTKLTILRDGAKVNE